MKHHPAAQALWRIHVTGAGVILALIAAVLLLIVRPRVAAAAQAVQERLALAGLEEEVRLSASRSQTARNSAASLLAEIEHKPAVLGPATDLNRRVGQISAAAEFLGLKVIELLPGTEIVERSHVVYPIRLRATGPVSVIPGFLRSLHGAFPDLAVVNISVRANPVDSAENATRVQSLTSVDFEWYAERDADPSR
jgi:hypothetical protein